MRVQLSWACTAGACNAGTAHFCRRETNDSQAILPRQDTSITRKKKYMQVVENLGAALAFLAGKGASASGSASGWAGQVGAHHMWATQANVPRHTAGTSGSLRAQVQAGNSDSAQNCRKRMHTAAWRGPGRRTRPEHGPRQYTEQQASGHFSKPVGHSSTAQQAW